MRSHQNLRLSAAVLIVLAGCEANPLEVRRTSCPAVAVVKHTGTLTKFRNDAVAGADDRLYTASIMSLDSHCDDKVVGPALRRKPKRGADAPAEPPVPGATTAVNFSIVVAGRAAGEVDVPYFVAVVKDGTKLISKQQFTAHVSVTDPGLRGQALQYVSVVSPFVPLPPRPRRPVEIDEFAPPPKAAPYEILIGFQLTDAEAAYNISK